MAKKTAPTSDSSSGNKVFGVRIDPELGKKLKILAIKRNVATYKLLEEGILDLLKKYKEN